MTIFKYFRRLCAVLFNVACLFPPLFVNAEETGLMLCPAQNEKNSSYIVLQPDLLDTQKQCDAQNKQQAITGANITTPYGQCSPINTACLADMSPGFSQNMQQIQALGENGQASSVIMIPMAKNVGVAQRVGVGTLSFLVVSQTYLFLYSGAGFLDTLALSLLAGGFGYLCPSAPAALWSLIGSWVPEMLTADPQDQASKSKYPLGNENYGSSSNTLYGERKPDGPKPVRWGGNMHKLNYDN